MISQLYELLGRGQFIPVIAHLDRYWDRQRKEQIEQLLHLGVPIQLSANILLKFFSRRKALQMIQRGQVFLLASDCHSLHHRPPNLGPAIKVVARQLGWRQARRLCRWAEDVSSKREEL